MILWSLERDSSALAKCFERSELEVRIRWHELRETRAQRKMGHRMTTIEQRQQMVELRSGGEKIGYIAALMGYSNTTVCTHTSKVRA